MIIESWWNGQWGRIGKRRVRLRHHLGRWSVELVGPWSRDEVVECRDEADARAVMRQAIDEGAGEKWRRLDHLY